MAWLVTGGAGYVGGAVVRALLDAGRRVVVLDDLSTGDRAAVPAGVPLVRASVTDAGAVGQALVEHTVTGVIHLAGRKSVAESMAQPLTYYRQNVGGTVAVLEAMAQVGVRQAVLSSSAAVYGAHEAELIDEDAVPCPTTPYGATKLACEWIVADSARAYGLRHVILRYFNVAGVAVPGLARRADGLLPCAVEAVAQGSSPVVFGRDHPTPDGSCVRDYVHVLDVASAHAAAVEALEAGAGGAVYNVGSGVGYSVTEVLDLIRRETGSDFADDVQPPRAGDPPRVVASVAKIRRDLHWRPRHGMPEIVHDECRVRAAPAPAPDRPAPPPQPQAPHPQPAQRFRSEPGTDAKQGRIVVVSAGVGAGHDGASRELARRLGERGFQVDCLDVLDILSFGRLFCRAYRVVLNRMPWVYGMLFRIALAFRGASPSARALSRKGRRKLLQALPPDTRAVVSTFPLATQLLGPLRRDGELTVPAITYFTDFGVNPIWVAPGVDTYCAGHEVSRAQACALKAADVRVAGRAVSARFRPGSPEVKRRARERLGLPPGRLVLLVAGSWGVGEVVATAAEIAGTGVAVPVVVCAGNKALYRRLQRRRIGRVLGWVDDMPALMHAADVLVENAGGLTALEAMACGLPVLTYRPITGHGTVNAATMDEAGVSTWVRRPDALGPTLVELIEGTRGQEQREAGLALFEADPATVIADAAKGVQPPSTADRTG